MLTVSVGIDGKARVRKDGEWVTDRGQLTEEETKTVYSLKAQLVREMREALRAAKNFTPYEGMAASMGEY